jgi:PAS domain S-box-containing protein
MSAKARILIVDDSPEVLEFLGDVVCNQGYDAYKANNGLSALELMENNSFHAAIIDVVLPDINGIELMRKLRRIDPDISPIVLTGHGEIEAAVKALNEGAEEYLLKPVNIQELEAILSKVITRRRTLEQKRQLEEVLQQSEEKYRKSVSKIEDAIILVETARHRIIDANAKAETVTGRRIQDLLKMTLFDLFPEMVHAELREILKKIRKYKQDVFSHLSIKCSDYSNVPIEAHAQWMDYKTGNHLQFILHDISAQKEVEAKRWRSQRFITFNEMADIAKDQASVPLAKILGQTESLKMRLGGKNTAVSDSLRSIEEQVQKIQNLLEHLRDFTNIQTSEKNTPTPDRVNAISSEHKRTERVEGERKHKILIVDDEPVMRQVLEDLFKLNSFEVVTCGDCENGLKKVKEEKIDLVLTDITMPGMDGIEFLRKVKRHSNSMPVILMTGISLNQVESAAKKYGADGYLVKPFSFFQMMKLVQESLKDTILTAS